MNSNCSICGGLIKLTTRTYPDFDVRPGIFQLIATCEDCGRSSTYDCVKPSPDKFVVDPKDPSVLRKGEPDEGMHKRAQDYINRTRSEEFHTRAAEPEPDNVIKFTGVTRQDVSPQWILEHLDGLAIQEIVAVGFLMDGSEFFASSKADGAAALWHLSRAQHKLMTHADLDEEGE